MQRRSFSVYTQLLLLGRNGQSDVSRCGQARRMLQQPTRDFKNNFTCRISTNSPLGQIAPKLPTNVAGGTENLGKDFKDEFPRNERLAQKDSTDSRVYENLPGESSLELWNEKSTGPLPVLFENSIVTAESVKELLNFSTSSTLILKHACLILLRLGQLSRHDARITFEELSEDGRFVRICNLIQRGNYSQSPQSLFFAIHGLQALGVSTTSDVFKTLATEFKWALRRCPVKYLARAIELFSVKDTSSRKHLEHNLTKESEEVFAAAIETLQLRWVEVTAGSDFISVFKVLNFLNDETRSKLENRAVEMVPTFSSAEMRKIFVVLGAQKRRPTPLLRTLAFNLSKIEDKATAKDLIELTYALNELTFADPVLMDKICISLCPEISSVGNPALISSLITSIGQMRYKHKGLIQILDEWIQLNLKNLRPFDCAAWLLTCAVLNHKSTNTNSFCTHAKRVLSPHQSSNDMEWINIVHALLVLGEHSEEFIASALKPEISKKIDALGNKSAKTKIKLLNINAMAHSLIPNGYKGPLLDSKYTKEWTVSYLGPSDSKLTQVTIESLGNFLPSTKYLQLNLKLELGVFADAVCYFSDNMDPLPITSDLSKNSTPNLVLVAIIVEGYPSWCLGVKEPTGCSILKRNLLISNGFRVVVVPYTEFNASERLLRRVKYLEDKIKSVCKHGAVII